MSIKELLGDLQRKISYFDDNARERLKYLVNWMGRYQRNRHIAAHGAFSPPDDQGNIRVMYTHVRKDHGKKVYYPEETLVTRALVDELISDADRILRAVFELDREVQLGKIEICQKD